MILKAKYYNCNGIAFMNHKGKDKKKKQYTKNI